MKTEHLLAKKLKEMMAVQPLDDISVMSLSRACDINRKTFYYHFHDIYDLLTLVFLDERMDGLKDVNNSRDLLLCIYNYYSKNSGFIDATLASAGKDLFSEFIYNSCYHVFLKIINNHPEGQFLPIVDKKNISRFYASGYSNAIVIYLVNTRIKSLESMKTSISFLGPRFLENAIAIAREIRKKETKF